MFRKIALLFLLTFVIFTGSMQVYATVLTEATQPEETVDIEYTVQMNEYLKGVYETWTGVIGAILTVTAIFGIAFPMYSSRQMDKKIQAAVANLKKDIEKESKKQIGINSALLLFSSNDYAMSNDILKKLMQEYPQDVYLHLLFGRNVFYEFYAAQNPSEIKAENLHILEEGIEHYLKVAQSSPAKQSEYYELGAVFPDSIIHELCILTGRLLEYTSEHPTCGNYHKLARTVLHTIENLLGIKKPEDIGDEEPTNVHIMNYIILNRQLAESYEKFGSSNAEKQYERVLRLYDLSFGLDYEAEKATCQQALERLGKTGKTKCHCRKRSK